jgi:hypothetical protein
MLGAFAVNRALIPDAERTWLARPNLMSTYFDLQPAVTASRAASAGSRILGFHRRCQTLAALLAGNLFRKTRRFERPEAAV